MYERGTPVIRNWVMYLDKKQMEERKTNTVISGLPNKDNKSKNLKRKSASYWCNSRGIYIYI